MSNAVGFLVIPILAAIVGSLLIWAVSRSRRPVEPGFRDQLQALSPDDRSRPYPQPTGIVTLDDPPAEEH